MKINKTYKFRLNPTQEQKHLLLQQTGNSRFLWNKLVEFNKEYKKENNNKFPSQSIFQTKIVKLKKENEFLKSTYSQPLQINAKRITKTNVNSVKPETIQERNSRIAQAKKKPENQRKKAIAKAIEYGYPSFKKKSDMKGNLFYPQSFKIAKSRISFPKLGWIEYTKHRKIEGKPLNVSIVQDGDQWYVCICCEAEIEEMQKPNLEKSNIVGIDLGIKDFAVLSNGTKIANPRTLSKHRKKLAKEQRKLSKKQFVEKEINGKNKKVSSENREKQRQKVQKIHRKVRNIRNDFLHKKSHDIITKYDGVVLETLDIQEMLHNNKKNQNRNTCDVSWYEFGRMLEYKCLWNSKWFHKIDKYFASSQICSECGNKQEMSLEKREYLCQSCGSRMDRDYNASLNIRKQGISELKAISTAGTAGFEACGQTSLEVCVKQEKRKRGQADCNNLQVA